MKRAIALSLMTLALLACNRDGAPTAPSATPAAPTSPAPVAPAIAPLADVSETTPGYIIGISYPPVANQYPSLAAELRKFAEAARNDLIEAAKPRKPAPGEAPYDLSLSFVTVHESPALLAIAADGNSYTGGAHAAPLLGRWIWLPQQNQLLTAQALIPDTSGWAAISAHVREQLHSALSQRVDADELPPGERAEVVKSASQMIDEGTKPDPVSFSQFEPVVDPQGKLSALRFVFPPYQVGPYSDGVQTVEVPAAVLLPHVAPAYRGLFVGG